MPRGIIRTLLPVLALLAVTGCMNYDPETYTLYDSAWCVVQGKGSQMALVTDTKDILKPSESLDSIHIKPGARFRAIYIPLGDQGSHNMVSAAKLVEITSLQPVLVEDALQHSSYIGQVNDPVWMNLPPFLSGGFLNFDFQFYSSETDVVKHGIHLLQDSLVNRRLYLRFGHDANGDSRAKTASALASFPIHSLKEDAGVDSLIILMKGESRFHAYRLALKDSI